MSEPLTSPLTSGAPPGGKESGVRRELGSGLQSRGGGNPALAAPFERRKTEMLWVGCGAAGPQLLGDSAKPTQGAQV